MRLIFFIGGLTALGAIFFFILSKQWQASVYLDLKVILLLAIIIVVGAAGMIGPQKATIVSKCDCIICLLGISFQFLDFVGFVMILLTVYICTKE